MAPRPLLLVASLALGCAEPEIRGPDAATTADVAALDLPMPGDAPDAELFVDASPLDAPSVDAPVVDVPSVDAPFVDVPPLEDFSLGPYPSALAILLPSLRSNARAYDSSRTFGHSAAQGYVLQAVAGTFLGQVWSGNPARLHGRQRQRARRPAARPRGASGGVDHLPRHLRGARRAVGRAGVSSESAPPSDGARGRRRPMDAHHLRCSIPPRPSTTSPRRRG